MPFHTLSCPEPHLERNEPPHWSTCLHVLTLTSFSYTLVSRPWTTLTDTKLPRRSSRTTSFPTYFSLSFVAYTLSIQSPSLAPPRLPYYTKPRPSRIMYLSTRGRTPSIQCSFPQFNFLSCLRTLLVSLCLLLYDPNDAAPTRTAKPPCASLRSTADILPST